MHGNQIPTDKVLSAHWLLHIDDLFHWFYLPNTYY